MYRIWKLVDPRRALFALYAFLGLLAVVIHLILLSSNRFNWIENGTLTADKAPVGASKAPAVAEMAPLPPNR